MIAAMDNSTVDALVVLAKGDVDLVTEAVCVSLKSRRPIVWYKPWTWVAQPDWSADLNDVIAYITSKVKTNVEGMEEIKAIADK